MKLIDVFIFLMIFSVFVLFSNSSLRCVEMLEKSLMENRIRSESTEFIYESFRNTCMGKGFNSLNEWQKNCRAMWSLDYIAWADASDFMDVEKEILYYGTWSGKYGKGEVYCRK